MQSGLGTTAASTDEGETEIASVSEEQQQPVSTNEEELASTDEEGQQPDSTDEKN